MKYRDPSTGQFRDLHFKVSDTLAIGSIIGWGGITAPEGWLICDGSAVSRTAYSALFATIGTTYGAGDGSTTFNLPDYRDRVPVGLDTNDSDFNVLGKTLGEKTHTLTIDEMPSHDHNAKYGDTAGSTGAGYLYSNSIGQNNYIIENTGGGQAHNIIQPSIVTNYIIKAYQVVAAPAKVVNEYSENTKEVYSASYVNDIIENVLDSKVPRIYRKNVANGTSITFNGDNRSTYLVTTTSNSGGTRGCWLVLSSSVEGTVANLTSAGTNMSVTTYNGVITITNNSQYGTYAYVIELANDSISNDQWK